MNVQIIYASRTGCTEKVAKAIAAGLPDHSVTLCNLADGTPEITGDVVLLGYWGIQGGPDKETAELIRTVRGKAVGVFCTLGYYADSRHGRDTLEAGFNLLKDRNEIIGGFVCNGAVAKNLMKGQGKIPGAVPTEQKELRWAVMASHPTEAECSLAAERFRERIWLCEQSKKLGIPFRSVL